MRAHLLLRTPAVVLGVLGLLAASACGRGTSPLPTTPSTAITVAAPAASNQGVSSVSWPCFTQTAGRAGGFGASGCPSGPVTTARVTTSAMAPPAPSNLSTSVSGSTVTLSWSAPAGGDPPTSYSIEAGSGSGASDIASFSSGNTQTALVVLGVPAGTYFVRIRAVNSSGASGPSNEVVVVVGTVSCLTTTPPTGLTANVTGATVVLSWTAPVGCAPTSYILQAGSAPGLSNLANFSTGSTATTFTASGVQNGTYYVRVLSTSGGLPSAPSIDVVFTVPGGCITVPNAPANLTASVASGAIRLAWDASTGACAATSYLVVGGTSPGGSNITSTTTGDTTLTVSGLGPGTYYFRVRGVNAAGQSSNSNEVSVTIERVSVVASFQLFDPATQAGPTTECRIVSGATPPQQTTCTLRSNSFTLGSNAIVSYAWTVRYTYDSDKTIEQTSSSPNLSFSELCGLTGSSADGAPQPLAVTLTVTDNLGATATATSGTGSQPPLQLRLFTCNSAASVGSN